MGHLYRHAKAETHLLTKISLIGVVYATVYLSVLSVEFAMIRNRLVFRPPPKKKKKKRKEKKSVIHTAAKRMHSGECHSV